MSRAALRGELAGVVAVDLAVAVDVVARVDRAVAIDIAVLAGVAEGVDVALIDAAVAVDVVAAVDGAVSVDVERAAAEFAVGANVVAVDAAVSVDVVVRVDHAVAVDVGVATGGAEGLDVAFIHDAVAVDVVLAVDHPIAVDVRGFATSATAAGAGASAHGIVGEADEFDGGRFEGGAFFHKPVADADHVVAPPARGREIGNGAEIVDQILVDVADVKAFVGEAGEGDVDAGIEHAKLIRLQVHRIVDGLGRKHPAFTRVGDVERGGGHERAGEEEESVHRKIRLGRGRFTGRRASRRPFRLHRRARPIARRRRLSAPGCCRRRRSGSFAPSP